MKSAMRMVKSFTIEPEVNDYVASTKGEQSASERVNELLKRAIMDEQYEKLEAEAATFYGTTRAAGRTGTKAFQTAALRTLSRE
jgi:hypothetical protein